MLCGNESRGDSDVAEAMQKLIRTKAWRRLAGLYSFSGIPKEIRATVITARSADELARACAEDDIGVVPASEKCMTDTSVNSLPVKEAIDASATSSKTRQEIVAHFLLVGCFRPRRACLEKETLHA